jgi:hypothetical protein
VGGMETRRTSKYNGTSTMRRVGLQILESYKVEEKLLVSFRIMQIM